MRAIDGDRLKRKAQKVATEAWKMKLTAKVETTLNQFIDWIDEQPTIEPRKKGKWIDETFKPWGLVHHPYKCDQCGEHSETDSDFCPNCGADMREPEDIPMEYFESGGR